MTEVTHILSAIAQGDPHAAAQLLPLVYDELRKLAAARLARLVELRYFAGLTGDQAARILGIAPKTADRYWAFARAWLRRDMEGGEAEQKNPEPP
jgi:hypothetical protein